VLAAAVHVRECDLRVAGLAEFGEQAADAVGGALVAFDLAVPAALFSTLNPKLG